MGEVFIPIVYAVNDNYTIPLCCSIKSLIKNSKETNFKIYILYSENNLSKLNQFLISLLRNDRCEIEFIEINNKLFSEFVINSECPHTSIETYYRFLLPDILYNTDKVIYLDCDTIILSDISELCKIDLNSFYMAGVNDYSKEAFCKRLNLSKYINAGVSLLNLKKIREENMQKKIFEYAIENIQNLPYQDQDVLNIIFQNGIKELDKIWNLQLDGSVLYNNKKHQTLDENIKIIHYISAPKPWQINYKSDYKRFFYNNLYSLNIALIIKYAFYRLNCLRKEFIYYSKTSRNLVLFRKFHLKF